MLEITVLAFFFAFSHIKNAKNDSFDDFYCIFTYKNVGIDSFGIFRYKKTKALNSPFTRNSSPSSDRRRMFYSSFERARRELSNTTKIIFLASIDYKITIK